VTIGRLSGRETKNNVRHSRQTGILLIYASVFGPGSVESVEDTDTTTYTRLTMNGWWRSLEAWLAPLSVFEE
jgi:hypothetical protein